MRSLVGLVVILVAQTAAAKSSNPAFLGVQMEDVGGARGSGPCMITNITKDSAAEAAGLLERDLFVSIDDEPIANCDALVSTIQERAPGQVVSIVVHRERTQRTTVRATLLTRDEVLRKRFGGLPVPMTKLIRVDDGREIDLSTASRQTTIVGWYPTDCQGCERIFSSVARWTRDDRKTMPIKLAAVTAGDLRRARTVSENLEMLKARSKMLDAPLLVADPDTYKEFVIGDGDRIQFMVIDCRGIVQYAAFIVPGADDTEAVLDELFAAAEQAARKK